MTKGNTLLQSKWYHALMATIYFFAGILILVKGYSGDSAVNTLIAGWLLCIYGTYRIISKMLSIKKVEKAK